MRSPEDVGDGDFTTLEHGNRWELVYAILRRELGVFIVVSLTILTLPASSVAICSRSGSIPSHGSHSSAEKRTMAGSADLRTSSEKLEVSTTTTAWGAHWEW